MSARIEIIDTTGRVWLSDPDAAGELTDEARAQLADLFSDWPKLNYLSLAVDGSMTYFNPANVIAARIVDFKQPNPDPWAIPTPGHLAGTNRPEEADRG